jgi:hypothetical protein
MLFKEMIVVYTENHMKLVNKNEVLLTIEEPR